jgi:very-short-patch-repair endonuclease
LKSTASITHCNEKQIRVGPIFLEQAGWRVIRFSASEAVQNPESIWAEIVRVLGIEA